MKLYVWRHNKTYHSHSMIQEPCVNTEFYLDAIAIVAAESLEEALKLLEEQHKGWRTEICVNLNLLFTVLMKVKLFLPN